MVEHSSLMQVNMLNGELNRIARVVDLLDAGGRIVQMAISGPPDENRPMEMIMVDTEYISYPPQMVDAIKVAMVEREYYIRDKLASLGVTGIEEPNR